MPAEFRVPFALVVLAPFSIVSLAAFVHSSRRKRSKVGESNRESADRKIDSDCIEQIEYYKLTRDEVAREDKILGERISWLIQFQGFMIAAVATLIALGWPTAKDADAIPYAVLVLRKLALLALPIIGILFAHAAFVGIQASRRSMDDVVAAWNAKNERWRLFPTYVPQPVGQGSAYADGGRYPTLIAAIFVAMWYIFLFFYITFFRDDLLQFMDMFIHGKVSSGCVCSGAWNFVRRLIILCAT